MEFRLHAPYSPTGDQPEAIAQICESIASGSKCTTLMGVTGSGKTFTMANVIERLHAVDLGCSRRESPSPPCAWSLVAACGVLVP